MTDAYAKDGGRVGGDNQQLLKLDRALLKIMVSAENARNPALRLRAFEDVEALARALKNGSFQEGRATLLIGATHSHTVAADIKRIGDTISMVILDPVFDDKHLEALKLRALPAMHVMLPPEVRVTSLIHRSQRSESGCKIYALSAASKMADHPELLDAFHADSAARDGSAAAPKALTWPSPDGELREVPVLTAHRARYRVLDATAILPGVFLKHAQSMATFKPIVEGRSDLKDQAVNKRSQTLLQRIEAGRAERPAGSIEQKRLVYLDRALAYVATVSDREAAGMLKTLKSDLTRGKF